MQRTWANEQARRTYPNFLVALDQLVAEDVIWEPYSAAAVGSRAPYGLSSLCTSNKTLWYTQAALVYDIYIEAHCPHRVMRQFGYAQQFPVPRVIDRVSPQDHRYVSLYKMHQFKRISCQNARKRTIYILFQVRSAWATMLSHMGDQGRALRRGLGQRSPGRGAPRCATHRLVVSNFPDVVPGPHSLSRHVWRH